MTFIEFAELSMCDWFAGEWGYGVMADSVAFADRALMYDLADYAVSSLSGGVYWLVKRGRGV